MAEHQIPPHRRKHHAWKWRLAAGIAIAILVTFTLRGFSIASSDAPLVGFKSSGAAVTELQESLKAEGINPGPIDGHFGHATQQAVYTFQRRNGLRVDGIVGKETWAAIKSPASDAETASAANAESSSPPPGQPEPAQGTAAVPESSGTTSVQSEPKSSAAAPASSAVAPSISPLYAPDISRILDRGVLIVAMLGTDSPPFFQKDTPEIPCSTDESTFVIQDGEKLCGLDVELGKGLAEQLGVEVRFNREADTFNNVVNQVFERQADIAISKISRTLSRTQKVIFSNPYLNMRQALLVNRVQFAQQSKGRRPEVVIRELTGNIAAIASSSYVGFTQGKFPEAEVREYPTWEDAVQSSRNGDTIAAYRDELEVKKIILKDPDTALNFQTVVLTDTNDAIAMVLPWDSQQLQSFVNQYLETNQLEYTADRLLDKYSGLLAKSSNKPSAISRQSGKNGTS